MKLSWIILFVAAALPFAARAEVHSDFGPGGRYSTSGGGYGTPVGTCYPGRPSGGNFGGPTFAYPSNQTYQVPSSGQLAQPIANQVTTNPEPEVARVQNNVTNPATVTTSDSTPSASSESTSREQRSGESEDLVPNPDNVPLSEAEREIVRLTNEYRRTRTPSLPPLKVKQELMDQSRTYSVSANGSYKGQQDEKPVHSTMGGSENVGGSIGPKIMTAKEWVDMWIRSPGHEAAMVGAKNFIGVGTASHFATQRFE